MPFDNNNNYVGNYFGKDRQGHTTPDCDASEPIQPFLPVSYPAPWIPAKRRDDAHPVGLNVVISHANIVGVDKNGGLIPAGLFSGSQKTKAAGGKFCYVVYGPEDVGWTLNPKTGKDVVAAGEKVLIAAPSDADGVAGETVDGLVFTGAEVAWAKTCDLVPGGVCRGLGYALRNMWQYLGGVDQAGLTGGVNYTLDTQNPTKFKMSNFMAEMGNAIRTTFVLRMPWIGETPSYLQTIADSDGIQGYTQSAYSKSFTHFTGVKGNAAGQLFPGALVVPSTFAGDAGNYMPFDPTKHDISQVVGHVMGIQHAHPIKDFANRVRTQFERGQNFKGAFTERNPVTGLMGGSATRGIPYQVSVGTNGLYRNYIDQGKANLLATPEREALYTAVLVMITLS